MFGKGTKINSIIKGTCPSCQKESMYVNANPYVFKDVIKMHEKCSHCGLKYQMDPSFFYGAMYVSYALSVAVGVAVFVIFKMLLGLPLVQTFIAMVLGLVILYPFILRISRNIWINMFVDYQEKN
jgi:uncharacterized protein (DUF983 family)